MTDEEHRQWNDAEVAAALAARSEREELRAQLRTTGWPFALAFAATPNSVDDQDLRRSIQAAHDLLAEDRRVAGAARRSEVRWAVVDADECDAVLEDLGVEPGTHRELRAYCGQHPGGRLVIAGCSYEPSSRAITVL